LNQRVRITYGKGEIVGEKLRDEFCFGCDRENVCLDNQEFLATVTEQDESANQFDGIVGMGYDALANSKSVTPFTNLIRSKSCDEKLFSFWLHRDRNGKPGGELTLCGYDSHYFVGAITWVPVSVRKYWQIDVEALRVNSLAQAWNFQAIIDTGTSLIVGPYSEVEQLNTRIGAKPLTDNKGQLTGLYTMECGRKSRPPVAFVIKGREFTLTEDEYVIRANDNKCYSAFSHGFSNNALWILGDAFLGKYYSIYDVGLNRVGLALANPPPPPAWSSAIRTDMNLFAMAFFMMITVILKGLV